MGHPRKRYLFKLLSGQSIFLLLLALAGFGLLVITLFWVLSGADFERTTFDKVALFFLGANENGELLPSILLIPAYLVRFLFPPLIVALWVAHAIKPPTIFVMAKRIFFIEEGEYGPRLAIRVYNSSPYTIVRPEFRAVLRVGRSNDGAAGKGSSGLISVKQLKFIGPRANSSETCNWQETKHQTICLPGVPFTIYLPLGCDDIADKALSRIQGIDHKSNVDFGAFLLIAIRGYFNGVGAGFSEIHDYRVSNASAIAEGQFAQVNFDPKRARADASYKGASRWVGWADFERTEHEKMKRIERWQASSLGKLRTFLINKARKGPRVHGPEAQSAQGVAPKDKKEEAE